MNISVPDDLAERVRELDLPISRICQAALRSAADAAARETGVIEVEIHDHYGKHRHTEAFEGRWLVEPDPDKTRTGEEGYEPGAYWGVAQTRRGRIAVYMAEINVGFAPQLTDYDSLDDAKGELPEDILAKAKKVLGEPYAVWRDI
jgi:Post-segregation antitoxin CcdA